jgi:hypothetical protein
MNCREFTAEFEERRDALSQPARFHLSDCPDCKKTSGEQTRLWQMIDGLKRIDAPNDFDFRVKAKIAGAKPADFEPRFLPALRYVLPLFLIVAVFGLLVFNTSLYFGGNGASPVADAVLPPPSGQGEPAPLNSFANNQIAVADAPREIPAANIANARIEPIENSQRKPFVAVKFPPKPRTAAPKKNVKDDFVGVRDLAVTKPAEKFPLGLNPNQPVETLPNVNDSNSIGGEEVLRILGIEAVRESGNLKVKTIRENSSAERSDVKVGDVIEAIDGVKLSAEPLRLKRIEAKKLIVLRGADKIEITLKN